MRINNNKGFTIIELLIVIVIIGILVAITAVSYTGITNGANTATAQANARAVSQKAIACQAKGGTWPAATALSACDGGGVGWPAGVTAVAATTPATADTAITSANQKTHVGFDASNGNVYYWDSTRTAAPYSVKL